MAELGPQSFIVVHDYKGADPRSRIGVLTHDAKEGVRYTPYTVAWPPSEKPPGDIESICPVPGREREFLAAESGPYKGPGRIFHLAVGAFGVLVRGRALQPDGVRNVEGMACVLREGGSLLVYLGEREMMGKGRFTSTASG